MFAAQRQYVPHIIHSLILRKYGNKIQKHAEKNKKRECVRLLVYLVLFATLIKFPALRTIDYTCIFNIIK